MDHALRTSGAATALLLAGCGAGSGGGIASTPTPIASAPAPAPPPAAQSVLKPDVIALESDQPFVTFGVTETDTLSPSYDKGLVGSKDTANIISSQPSPRSASVDFRFDPLTKAYSISLPDGTSGQLSLKYLNGSVGRYATSTGHTVSGANGDLGVLLTMPVPFSESFNYTYSHYGSWEKLVPNSDGSATRTYGLFAYGHETPSASVPRSGAATYLGTIIANSPADPWEVTGTVNLAFDFGAGTLSGSMHPVHGTNGWYPSVDYDYGRYDFDQTIYAVGSSRYSGRFAKDGVPIPDSWFDGSLTGPGAEETIGRFAAPFTRNGASGVLTGIWTAKRGQ